MRRNNYDWQSETHTIRVFKILGNPLKEDFDPIASFFGSAEKEAMEFVQEYVKDHPNHHIFADKVANEPYTLLFDSKPEVTEAALRREEARQPQPEDPPEEDVFRPAFIPRPPPRPRRPPAPRVPSASREEKKRALQEWLARGRERHSKPTGQ